MSLDEFAEAQAVSKRCLTCNLAPDLREEVENGRKRPKPRSFAVIANYLREKHKVQITEGAVRQHFANGHAQ